MVVGIRDRRRCELHIGNVTFKEVQKLTYRVRQKSEGTFEERKMIFRTRTRYDRIKYNRNE